MRRIAHLDMDAFFASVELLRYPQLRGEAVVVGGRGVARVLVNDAPLHDFANLRTYRGRGVVTTSTYEARAWGVFSGMGLMTSARHLEAQGKDAVLLPASFDAYREYSHRFKAAIAMLAPKIEDRGIDEIYIDLSDFSETSETLAKKLQSAVFDATGLSCSIGIAENRLLAKIASDMKKPAGITILEGIDDVRDRIWPLPVRKINGVGPKAEEKLHRLGVLTVGDLAVRRVDDLIQHFGKRYGAWLCRAAQGEDDTPLTLEREVHSVSRESTFDRDLSLPRDKAALSQEFLALCERVAADLQKKGLQCHTVGIKLRYADFQSLTRAKSLPQAIDDAKQIREAARDCLRRVSFQQPIRLLGVRLSGLAKKERLDAEKPCQGTLF